MVEESLQGLLYANGDLYEKVPDACGIISKRGMEKQPLYLVEAAVINQCSPDWSEKECLPERQSGMLLLLLIHTRSRKRSRRQIRGRAFYLVLWNYAGDTMNLDVAEDLASMEGVKVSHVIVNDDIASAPKEDKEGKAGSGRLHSVCCQGSRGRGRTRHILKR